MLVIPYRAVPRLTDLTTDELTDVFVTVQKVQKMLASVYFTAAFSATRPPWETSSRAGQTAVREDHQGQDADAKPLESPVAAHGSFNIAIQDGQDAGQTVAHVHCHIIPRRRADADGVQGDRVYNLLQGEQGNVGGGFYDRERPVQKGKFPKIEEDSRMPRERDDMNREAAYYAARMERCQL